MNDCCKIVHKTEPIPGSRTLERRVVYSIEYCPLHKVAPDMLAALEALLPLAKETVVAHVADEEIDKANAGHAKVEAARAVIAKTNAAIAKTIKQHLS